MPTYRKIWSFAALVIFLVANSGVAAVVSSCSMDSATSAGCCARDSEDMACAMTSDAETHPTLAGSGSSCFSSRIIGGFASDKTILTIHGEHRITVLATQLDAATLWNDATPSALSHVMAPDTYPSGCPPNLRILYASFLI